MTSDALFDEGKLKASLLTPADQESSEKTLAGSLIGSVRDLVSAKPTNVSDARDRAHTNDMLAEVAADTFAMMPGVGFMRAGLVRAAVLINPKADLTENGLLMGKNFAEGVALHGVSKLGGKAFQAEPALSRSLLSESVGLFKFGAGMGAVKAAFNEDSWKDKEGHFSFGDGLTNVAKAGTIGGIVGVPAGFAGNAVARFGLRPLAEAGFNQRAISVGLGMTSGYTAGAVFGGVDAIMQGGNAEQVFKSANQGGVAGLLAGGLTGGFIKQEAQPPKKTETTERVAAVGSDRAQTTRPTENGRIPTDVFAKVAIEPRTSLAGNLQRLGSPVRGNIEIRTAAQNAQEIANAHAKGKFADYADRAISKQSEVARIYRVRGLEIVVPEQYAAELDRVYKARIAKEKGFAPDASGLQRAEGERAVEFLKDHPLKDRAHPADLIAIDQLADRTLVRKVELLDSVNPEDPWHRATYKPTFTSAATASRDGVITFYKANRSADLAHNTHHEWGHLLKFKAVRESNAFENAAALEKFSHEDRSKQGHSYSEYSTRDGEENWAEHSATITRADPTEFFRTAEKAPIRTAIIGKALQKALALVPANQRSEYHGQISGRVQFIDQHVMPRAQELLEGYLLHGTPEEQIHAAKVLRELGGPKQVEALVETARTSKRPDVAEAAFDAAHSRAYYGSETFTKYDYWTGSRPARSYENFLIDMAAPESRSRTKALQHLETLTDDRSQGYYDLLTYDEQPHSRHQKLMSAMQKIPEMDVKMKAFELALQNAGQNRDARMTVLVATFQGVPELKPVALERMILLDPAKIEKPLQFLANHPENPLHKQGVEGLAILNAQRTFARLVEQAGSPIQDVRWQAMSELAQGGKYEALEPLLVRMGSASDAQERAYAQDLIREHFNHQLVKAAVRKLIASDVAWRPKLDVLLRQTGGAI